MAVLFFVFTASAHAELVTVVLTHGWSLDQSKGVWLEAMAEAMRARSVAAGGGSGAIFRYRQSDGAWQLISGTPDAGEPVYLISRWLDDLDKGDVDWGFAEGAADALYAALLDPHFVDAGGNAIAGVPLVPQRYLHFIGHSRGVIINSEVAERFAFAQIAVDYVTGLDPHPVNGTLPEPWPFNFNWGDPMPQRWSTTTFQDVYWRADGAAPFNIDFDGIPIPDSHNVELSESALDCCADSLAHLDVHLWYHGTIDLSQSANDGSYTITQEMRNTWWPMGEENTGFAFSRIAGGAAMRPSLPAGIAPGAVPAVYGGDFPQGSDAGWRYHGGGMTGDVLSSGGRTFLELNQNESALHNRMTLPIDAASITFERAVLLADDANPGRFLVVRSHARDAAPLEVARFSVDEVSSWQQGTASLPDEAPRGRTVQFEFIIEGAAGGNTTRVGVDSIVIDRAPLGDLNLDASVNLFDLLDMLAAWGSCDEPCPLRCLPDLTGSEGAPDCTVNVFDLLELLSRWD